MSSNLEHAAIKALAWVIGIGSAVMTGYFGSNFGGDHWFFVSLMFVIFFAISVLCPLLVNRTTSCLIRRQWGRFAALLLFAVLFVFVDIVTNGRTSSFLRKSDLVITENQNTKAKVARNEGSRLEKRARATAATDACKGQRKSRAASIMSS